MLRWLLRSQPLVVLGGWVPRPAVVVGSRGLVTFNRGHLRFLAARLIAAAWRRFEGIPAVGVPVSGGGRDRLVQMRLQWQLSICGTRVACGVYLVRMGVEVATRPVRGTADTDQAEYFRGLLDRRKCEVCERLEAELDALARVQRSGCLGGIRRHRRMVKALEAELRTVDGMLVALRVRLGLPTLRRTL